MRLLSFSLLLFFTSGLRAQFHEGGYGPLDHRKSLSDIISGLHQVSEINYLQYGSGAAPKPLTTTNSVDWAGFSGEVYFLGDGLPPFAGQRFTAQGYFRAQQGRVGEMVLYAPVKVDFSRLIEAMADVYGEPEIEEDWLAQTNYLFFADRCDVVVIPAAPEDGRETHTILLRPLGSE